MKLTNVVLAIILTGIFVVAGFAKNTEVANNKLGVIIVAHGGGAEWNAQIVIPTNVFDEKHPEILVEAAFLMARGETPTPQSACDRLVSRGATRIAVLPLFISSHSFHYDEVLYRFGKIDDLKFPEVDTHKHLPPIVKSPVPILDVLPAMDDSELAASYLIHALESAGAGSREFNLVLVAHGPNADDHARVWLQNMEGLMSHVRGKMNIKGHKCLLVRDDAGDEVRSRAVANIEASVEGISTTGETYVLPLLIANGHLSEEIPKMFTGTSGSYIKFCFAGAENIDEYFYDMVKSFVP